jgi:uncharacterized membrane-anchored protein YhcB (DUF1043 family)
MAGEVRARDVRYKLQGKIEPELLKVLEELAEQQHNLAKNQGTLAMLVDQMADITKNYVGVAEQMKKTIDSMREPDQEPEKMQ